jgi:hypothetical protein
MAIVAVNNLRNICFLNLSILMASFNKHWYWPQPSDIRLIRSRCSWGSEEPLVLLGKGMRQGSVPRMRSLSPLRMGTARINVGAVLVRNYASLDKHEKKFHVFFFNSLPINILQKLCMYSMDLKESKRELKREPKTPSLADFVQQLLHQNNCNIAPGGIEFAMMIPCPYSFGNVVA